MKQVFLALFIFMAAIPAFAAEGEKESAYERVIRAGTIRCGYVNYYPFFLKDPKTGENTGIFYDLVEKMGERLGLKIDWTLETSFDSMYEELRRNRIDAVCSGIWPFAPKAKVGAVTNAMFYSGVEAYARSGDDRFDETLSDVNAPDIKIATIDGEMSALIAAEDFPKAQTVSMPNLTDISQLLLNVQTGKADITFVETAVANEFMLHNPGAIKNITPEKPVRIFGNTILTGPQDMAFVAMLNMAQAELVMNGFVEKVIKKYEKHPGSFYLAAPPYVKREFSQNYD